ncbi:MAG: NAD(P)-binding domain-containing protein [Bacteroidota bacterium]
MTPKYCVIGAGPGGLSAAVALKTAGLAFDIFDAGQRPGGVWDIDRDDSPMYESAHFISSKTLSGFPDMPMPDHYPDYPRHDQLLEYIGAYADKHDLTQHIQFQTTVTELQPIANGKEWIVKTDKGDSQIYAGVVVANGPTWFPHMPDFPGEFNGESYHSLKYRSPEVFKGKRVLIVGGGNSGVDIACDAAQNAKFACISLRRGYHFIPKYVFGQPADVFAHGGPSLPPKLESAVFKFLMEKILIGDLRKYGLPKPDHRILESHPILNTQILHHLGHGDIEVRPNIKQLEGKHVRFEDDRLEEFDLIIYATGYERDLPFLSRELLPMVAGKLELYLNMFPPNLDNFGVIGMLETDGAAYSLFAAQAELIIQSFLLSENDPLKFEAFRENRQSTPDLRGSRAYLNSKRHLYYVKFDRYMKELKRQTKRWRTNVASKQGVKAS